MFCHLLWKVLKLYHHTNQTQFNEPNPQYLGQINFASSNYAIFYRFATQTTILHYSYLVKSFFVNSNCTIIKSNFESNSVEIMNWSQWCLPLIKLINCSIFWIYFLLPSFTPLIGQKYFSHPSLVIYFSFLFFPTRGIELKTRIANWLVY